MARLFRILAISTLLLSSLACQAVLNPLQQPPTPTAAPPTATHTPTVTLEPSSTPTPTDPPPSPTPTQTPQPSNTPTVQPTPSELQVRVFEELWSVIAEEYLYEDYNGLDWDEIHEEYLEKVLEGLSKEDFYWLMDEMVLRLGDEHSVFLSPEEVEQDQALLAGDTSFVGIGILHYYVPERRRLTIVLVYPGSPADLAGLQSHDSILAIDGEPIAGDDGVRWDLLRGEEGSRINITVQTPGEEPRDIPLTRRQISTNAPVPYHKLETQQGKRIGYLMLSTFMDETIYGQMRQALHEMSADTSIEGLIVDNRQNSGGTNIVFEDALRLFVSGRVGYFANRNARYPITLLGEDIAGSQSLPLVVLIGPRTASFGEIFAGVLSDLDRAYLIGETTDGNVEILWEYSFSDGSVAWIAHDTFIPLNDTQADWENDGIIPDLEVPTEWDQHTIDTDPAVRAALDYLDSQ